MAATGRLRHGMVGGRLMEMSGRHGDIIGRLALSEKQLGAYIY